MAAAYSYIFIKNNITFNCMVINVFSKFVVALTFLEKNGYTITKNADLYKLSLILLPRKSQKKALLIFLQKETIRLKKA